MSHLFAVSTYAALAFQLVPEARAAAIDCAHAAAIIERSMDIPGGLLSAIGRVESSNQPLAINADGQAMRFDRAETAVAVTRMMQARKPGSHIDVGCFQIDLAWHPDAFRDLRAGFDPMANGVAAGLFLRELYRMTGNWHSAVARYHAATMEGQRYAAQVFATYEHLTEPAAIAKPPEWAIQSTEYGITVYAPAAAAP